MTRRELVEIGITAAIVAAAAVCALGGLDDVLTFAVTGLALAALARLVGTATEQLGGRLGSGGAGVVQSALGNLPELFVALFALNKGLQDVVQSALVGSVLANSMLVLGLAFTVGGARHGTLRFNPERARLIATLTVLAAAILAMPSLAHAFHTPAARHEQALTLICAGVLLAIFALTLPSFLRGFVGEVHAPPRWSVRLTAVVLGGAAGGAALVSDWFVNALGPAIHTLHMSEDFAGLVIVAIAGNAVENVVGLQLAARNQPDFAISVIMNSSLQVTLALTPAIVFLSLFFSTHLVLTYPVLLAFSLLLAGILGAIVVYDGESNWQEGIVLVGLYVVIAASFWWGT